MTIPNCRFAIVALTLLSPLYWTEMAAGLEVPVQNDAQVQQATPNANFGSNANLCVHSTSGSQRYTYIKFDPASYMPAGLGSGQVAQALLYLYPNAVTTAGSISVYSVTSTWGEGKADGVASSGNISWNLRPTDSGVALATIPFATTDVDDFIALDVTSLVQSWISNPSQNYGLLLKANGTVVVNFDAKESVNTAHGPKLDITLTGPAGTAGTKWLTGTTAPAANIGSDGDFYLNTATSQYYTKVSGAWNTPVSLQGASGTNGTKWLSGSGAPTAGVGVNGDFYLDTTNSVYYGPKASGVWPGSGTSIKGAMGAQGPATIRIEESGDLSMGQFRSGTQP